MPTSNQNHQKPSSFHFPRWVGQLWLRGTGWTVKGDLPTAGKYVIIGAPHTSNWDFPFMMAIAAFYQLPVSWMGKDSLFKKPVMGGLLRRMGGIAIDRSKPTGVVMQVVQQMHAADTMALVIPPEGTRKKKEYWKSGFYWIALHAGVPIVCAYLDFARKEGGIGPIIIPSGDITADMDQIRAFYQEIQGKFPAQTTCVRLKEEDKEAGFRDQEPGVSN